MTAYKHYRDRNHFGSMAADGIVLSTAIDGYAADSSVPEMLSSLRARLEIGTDAISGLTPTTGGTPSVSNAVNCTDGNFNTSTTFNAESVSGDLYESVLNWDLGSSMTLYASDIQYSRTSSNSERWSWQYSDDGTTYYPAMEHLAIEAPGARTWVHITHNEETHRYWRLSLFQWASGTTGEVRLFTVQWLVAP